jgi:condensin complex subunit 1
LQLADQPAQLIEDVLGHVGKVGNFIRAPGSTEKEIEISTTLISRFLFLIGHTGIREMVYLDQSVYKELKRRNAVREKKKEMRSRISNTYRRKSINVSNSSNISTVLGSAQRSIRINKNDEDQEDGMEGATADDADAEHINMCLEEELLSENGLLSKFMYVPFRVNNTYSFEFWKPKI